MEYNEALQANLILYICSNATRKKLGTVKLNKILWFFDKFCYDQTGETATGETYIKKPRGPVASHFYDVCHTLESSDRLRIKTIGHNPRAEHFEPVEYVCRHQVSEIGLTQWQQGVLDVLISEICNEHTSRTISRLSHDVVWKAAAMNEPLLFISYYRKHIQPDADTVAWAKRCAEDYFESSLAENEY